jgi:anaerobic ribonucleoside-triphosphate reductase
MTTTPVAKCEECGYEITTDSKICINCGEKIHRAGGSSFQNLVKRVIFLIIAAYILLSALNIVK